MAATGADEAVFLIRPNAGMPCGPVADTASGGELSRIALAIAAVAGGETLVFDEIDAGIGGETANAVGRVLGSDARGPDVWVDAREPAVPAGRPPVVASTAPTVLPNTTSTAMRTGSRCRRRRATSVVRCIGSFRPDRRGRRAAC